MERETMRLMPAFSQPFISWLTAKPLPEQLTTRKSLTPIFHLVVSISLLLAGAVGGAASYQVGSLAGYLLSFVLATSGMKQIQVMICHNAAHGMVLQTQRANSVLGRILSAILMLKPFDDYKAEHVHHHDHQTLLTDLDDTLSFLKGKVGLQPYDTVEMMWWKLISFAFSPISMVNGIWHRFKSNITNDDRLTALATIAGWSVFGGVATYFGHLDTFIVAWAAPIFIGYHICTTFRLAAEHTWPSPQILRERGIAFIAESTTGVFIGEPLLIPDGASSIKRFALAAIWISKMLTVHLFIRLFVMVGDTPCHDFHHRRPRSRDWPNYITAREQDLLKGSKPYPKNYLDIWGYVNAVTNNFRSYQAAHDYYYTQNHTIEGVPA